MSIVDPQMGSVRSVDDRIDLVGLFPTSIERALTVSYTTEECGEPESGPTDYDLGECPSPPPLCPAGYAPEYDDVLAIWTCETNPGPPVPDPPTSSRETTTTSTSTTVDNMDGSFTTTTVTSTEYGECPPGETCAEGQYSAPVLGDVKTFRESLDAFWDEIGTAGIASVGSGLQSNVSESSTCPTYETGTIPLVEQSYTIDGHCTIVDGHEGDIRAIMAVVWSIIGIFILLSA